MRMSSSGSDEIALPDLIEESEAVCKKFENLPSLDPFYVVKNEDQLFSFLERFKGNSVGDECVRMIWESFGLLQRGKDFLGSKDEVSRFDCIEGEEFLWLRKSSSVEKIACFVSDRERTIYEISASMTDRALGVCDRVDESRTALNFGKIKENRIQFGSNTIWLDEEGTFNGTSCAGDSFLFDREKNEVLVGDSYWMFGGGAITPERGKRIGRAFLSRAHSLLNQTSLEIESINNHVKEVLQHRKHFDY